MTRHVIQMSGGLGSFWAAFRAREQHGPDNMTLLFADTLVEDPDLYRFLHESAAYLGVPLVTVADGRTPFEVFNDEHFLGNSRVAPCTKRLKQKPCRQWLTEHAPADEAVLYVGIDHFERQRCPAIVKGWAPWPVTFPMCDKPHWDKKRMIEECQKLDLEPPRQYALGYAHANCGGVCVRAGRAQWLHTLRVFPDLYRQAEEREKAFRAKFGDVSILREQRQGVRYPLTLAELRRRHEAETANAQPTLFDNHQLECPA